MALLRNSAVGRGVERMAGSPLLAKVGPTIVPKVDRIVSKVTGGRVMMSAGMVPSLMLHVRGAKSGRLRDTPLATVVTADSWYVVGSNWGKESHPFWTGNLLANPAASVTFKGKSYDVTATLLDAVEKKAVWPQLIRAWPNYDVYVERSQRDLRVFRLDRRYPGLRKGVTGMSQSNELPAPTAITNLLARYAELIDGGDFEGIGELFAHATVTADGQGSWTGAAQITKMYDDFTRKHSDGTPRTKHVITNHIVELDGPDAGRCRSYFTVFMNTPTLPLQPIVAGRYADEFARIDGVWCYVKRHMAVEFVGDVSEHLNMTLTR